MYFHIDESGNTGNNLFDPSQARLSYGVLSSLTNVDALGAALHNQMLAQLDVPILHANELGVGKLSQIAPQLMRLQEKLKFDFDYYFIDKPIYSLVILFDAIFDAGLNEAVKWEHYWTPFRFVIIDAFAQLLDEEILQRAWALCISKRIRQQSPEIVELLVELKHRAQVSDVDPRFKEIMIDAFAYGIANSQNLDFGVSDQKIFSPNAVCFQFVVSAMSMRLRKKRVKKACSIIVDRQAQFNQAQLGTHYNLKKISESLKKTGIPERRIYIEHPLFEHLGSDEITYRGMPKKDIEIRKCGESIGLQIVDIYLWIVNRLQAGMKLSPELHYLSSLFLRRAMVDGISLEGMMHRWRRFEEKLPAFDQLTDEQLLATQASIDVHRKKVQLMGESPACFQR